MYIVLFSTLVALGAALFGVGLRRRERRFSVAGVGVFVSTLALFGLFGFWGEML